MHVSRFMSAVPEVIEITYPMDKVMEIFDRTNAWNLPVVDNGRYVGFVSKIQNFQFIQTGSPSFHRRLEMKKKI